jgi:hypothetical protein
MNSASSTKVILLVLDHGQSHQIERISLQTNTDSHNPFRTVHDWACYSMYNSANPFRTTTESGAVLRTNHGSLPSTGQLTVSHTLITTCVHPHKLGISSQVATLSRYQIDMVGSRIGRRDGWHGIAVVVGTHVC